MIVLVVVVEYLHIIPYKYLYCIANTTTFTAQPANLPTFYYCTAFDFCASLLMTEKHFHVSSNSPCVSTPVIHAGRAHAVFTPPFHAVVA